MSHPDPAAGADEILDAEVVELFPLDPGADLVPVDDGPSRLAMRVATIADRRVLPSLEHTRAAAAWWARTGGRAAAWALTHPHRLLATELRPVGRGVVVCWSAWRAWCSEADYAAALAADPGAKATAAKDLATRRAGHRRTTAILAGALAGLVGLVWWLHGLAPLAVATIGLVGVLDLIGRRHPHPDQPAPPVRRTLLAEGAPLAAIGASVVARLNEDGVRADLAGPVHTHGGGEYRVDVCHEDAIDAKHLRSLERHLAARPGSIRVVGTDDSGTSQLRLPTRDHLARVPSRAWAPTGSRSIADPAPLWVRDDGDPSSPVLAGIHVDMVGTTGAGKSEAVQELISFYGECADVYPVFADLTMGPVGPLNRRVLRRTAYTEPDLAGLLDWVWARVQERHLELHRLAESDDDDAPVEWDLSWGPQIQLVIDEYSYVAKNPELHAMVEQIMRVGRKVRVCVVRASQKAGNADLGSTVASALVGVKILMACTERDTTSMLSTGHRDRGWSPHLFRPAVPGDKRDAGKCYVWGPAHRDPEIHRLHAPLPPGEVKRRDRRREADGLPNLDGTPAGEQPAITLSGVQAAAEAVFAARGVPWLPTRLLLADLAEAGHEVDAARLGDELGNAGSREEWDGRKARGYALADVHAAWGVTR